MLVTQEAALLWTDGRYFLQAERELGPDWRQMKLIGGVQRYNEWILANMKPGSKVGFDPFLMTAQTVGKLDDHEIEPFVEILPWNTCGKLFQNERTL